MRSNVVIYEALIASPGDVPDERRVLTEVIEDWNSAHAKATNCSLQARRWELDAVPEMGDRPQAIINRQLVEDADLLIGVFSTRLGSPTGVAASGTAEEIERLRSMKKPVMVYFSRAPLPRDHDAGELKRLEDYKSSLRDEGLYFEYEDLPGLRRMASRHLANRMNELMAVEAPVTPEPVSAENNFARVRIRSGQKGRNGDVTTISVIGEIQNLSSSIRIREYSCQLVVPAPLLKFSTAHYMTEVKSDRADKRVFRHTEADFAKVPIMSGDTLQVVSVELSVDHLDMTQLTGLSPAEAHELAMTGVIVAEAIVDGKLLRVERPIREIFSLAGASGRISLGSITG